MKVREITVSAGRVIPHPFQSYANLRPMVSLKADIDDGEDYEQMTKELQAKVEGMVEDHSRYMVKSLEELHELSEKRAQAASLEGQIRRAQRDLDAIRKGLTALPGLSVEDTDDRDP